LFPASYYLSVRSELRSSVQQAGLVVALRFQEPRVHSAILSALRPVQSYPCTPACRKKFPKNRALSPLSFVPRKMDRTFLLPAPERLGINTGKIGANNVLAVLQYASIRGTQLSRSSGRPQNQATRSSMSRCQIGQFFIRIAFIQFAKHKLIPSSSSTEFDRKIFPIRKVSTSSQRIPGGNANGQKL
jgi:hypothetical protein